MSEKFKATAFRSGQPLLPRRLLELLHRVSQLELKTKLRHFPALLILIFSIVWLFQGLVDRYFRLSWETRASLLAIQAAVVAYLFWKHVLVPLSKKLDRRRAALLIERGVPEFDSSLISVVEFCETPGGFPHHASGVVRRLIEQVELRSLVPGLAEKVVDTSAIRTQERKAIIAAGVLALGIALAGLPLSWTLGKRIFLSRDPLPGDTTLICTTGDFTVDAGTDATVTVKALGLIPPVASLKISSAGGTSTIPVNLTADDDKSLYSYTVKNVRENFSYQFEANDGVSDSCKVSVNTPPRLEGIRFIQTYPPYTGLPETEMSPGSLRLLEGSELHIEAKATEALESAALVFSDGDRMWMEDGGEDHKTFGIKLTVPARGWTSFSVALDAGESRKSSNEPVYRVDIITDRPPTASMVLPKKDRITVIPGSKIDVSYKAADDFGLSGVEFCYRVADAKEDAYAENTKRAYPLAMPERGKTFTGENVLDLSKLVPLPKVGSSIHIWIEASDNNGIKGSATSISREKVITVVSEEQKRMELLELMSQRAKDIEKLYENQRGVNRKADDSIRASKKP